MAQAASQGWLRGRSARGARRVEADPEREAALTEIFQLRPFKRLSRLVKRTIENRLTIQRYESETELLRQGADNPGYLFIILDGQVETAHRPFGELVDVNDTVVAHDQGELLGHFSFLSSRPVYATVRARAGARVARLDLTNRRKNRAVAAAREALQRPIADYTAHYSRTSGVTEAALEVARIRVAAAIPLIATLALMSLYTLTLSVVPSVQALLPVNFIYTPMLIALFSLISWASIRASGVHGALFGFCNKRIVRAVIVSVFWSFVVLGALFAAKAWAIQTIPAFRGLQLFTMADIQVNWEGVTPDQAVWLALALYVVFAPFQELVARCGIQAPLQVLLDYQDRPYWRAVRVGIAILISNLVFAAAHAHLSLEFAIAAFIPGLIWGVIFYATNSLVAVSISHIIIGAGGLFLLGVEEMLTRLQIA